MNRPATWLQDHKYDVYSQTGEDGVIRKILDVLPQTDGWCVEFGAWDGHYVSNTRNLIDHYGYRAVLIEADRRRFRSLSKNYGTNPSVTVLNHFVGYDEETGLDRTLSALPIPLDFDLLSVDIDGCDYHVWRAVTTYKPKVVCIEFNPTIPTEVRFVQPTDSRRVFGTSLLALVELGMEKGYELVCVLPWNAFFVRSELFHHFRIEDNAPSVLRTSLEFITYLFSGYDGSITIAGRGALPWHRVRIKQSRLQHLPRFLRKYPGDYNPLQRAAYLAYRFGNDPADFLTRLKNRIDRCVPNRKKAT